MPQPSNEVILAIIAAIIGAVGGWFGKRTELSLKKESNKHGDQENQLKFINILIDQNRELKDSFFTMRTDLEKVQITLKEVEEKLKFYEENSLAVDARELLALLMDDNPNPMWIHSVGSESRWYVNAAYCEVFNVRRPSFWTPINILARYPVEATLQYIKHDLDVVRSNSTQIFEEIASKDIQNPNCLEKLTLKVKKTPVCIHEHTYVVGEVLSYTDIYG